MLKGERKGVKISIIYLQVCSVCPLEPFYIIDHSFSVNDVLFNIATCLSLYSFSFLLLNVFVILVLMNFSFWSFLLLFFHFSISVVYSHPYFSLFGPFLIYFPSHLHHSSPASSSPLLWSITDMPIYLFVDITLFLYHNYIHVGVDV